MNQPYECPKNCPNRKLGCQNPNTCEIYKARVQRSADMRRDYRPLPYKNLPRNPSVITARSKAR